MATANALTHHTGTGQFSIFYGQDHKPSESISQFDGEERELDALGQHRFLLHAPTIIRDIRDLPRIPIDKSIESLSLTFLNTFPDSKVLIERLVNLIFIFSTCVKEKGAKAENRIL